MYSIYKNYQGYKGIGKAYAVIIKVMVWSVI